MHIDNKRNVLLALALTATAFVAPLVYAGIGSLDLAGQTRAIPPTIGALEVATTVVPAVPPTPVATPSMPVGLAIIRLNAP